MHEEKESLKQTCQRHKRRLAYHCWWLPQCCRFQTCLRQHQQCCPDTAQRLQDRRPHLLRSGPSLIPNLPGHTWYRFCTTKGCHYLCPYFWHHIRGYCKSVTSWHFLWQHIEICLGSGMRKQTAGWYAHGTTAWHIPYRSITGKYVSGAPGVADYCVPCEHSQRNELATAQVLAGKGV